MSKTARARAMGLTLAGALAACGGGGGGGGPVSPPPAPTLPPAPAGVVAMSKSGGVLRDTGAIEGEFRGPLSLLTLGVTGETPQIDAVVRSGTTGDFRVSVGPVSGAGDEPTVTVTLNSAVIPFDFDMAVPFEYQGGVLHETNVANAPSPSDAWLASQLDFGGLEMEHARLLFLVHAATGAASSSVATAYAALGTDVVAMPASGSAVFDTGVTGIFATAASGGDGGSFVGRSDVTVNFGSGGVTGSFASVDWIGADGSVSPTAPGGADFGLRLDAQVSGDDFRGMMATTGGQAPVSGQLEGDFYGPYGGRPDEIGGAFTLKSATAYGVGGFLGKAK